MTAETYTYNATAIRTYTGRYFDYLQPKADDINILDIAVHLAREPRWASATKERFSVGQHLVLTCDYIKDQGGTQVDQLLGLAHDWTEAYTKDLPKPFKNVLPGYCELENKIWDRICLHFFRQKVKLPEIVKKIDGVMLNAENRDLRAYYHADEFVRDNHGIPAYPYTIEPWPESKIIFEFLSRFNILYQKHVLEDAQWDNLRLQ